MVGLPREFVVWCVVEPSPVGINPSCTKEI
jgi:hypothetical protein